MKPSNSTGLCIFFLFVPFLSCIQGRAQTPSYSQIDYKKLIVSGVPLGSERGTLTGKFGEPDRTVTKTNEFEGTLYEEYVYGKSSLFISADRFEGFIVRDSAHHLDAIAIHIGDNVESLKKEFPLSLKNKYQDDQGTVVKVQIGNTDSYLLFRCVNNIIMEISTWNDL